MIFSHFFLDFVGVGTIIWPQIFLCTTVFFNTKMERFLNLTLDEIGKRYKSNEKALAEDLIGAGIIGEAGKCHGAPMIITEARPWSWRCVDRSCSAHKSIVDERCFLFGYRKYYEVFKCAYMWVSEYNMKQIMQECDLNRDTIRKLETKWREIVSIEGILLLLCSDCVYLQLKRTQGNQKIRYPNGYVEVLRLDRATIS